MFSLSNSTNDGEYDFSPLKNTLSDDPEDMWSSEFEERVLKFLQDRNIVWVPEDEVTKFRTQSAP